MTKANTPGRKQSELTPKANSTPASLPQLPVNATPTLPGKKNGKSHRSQIGGTAVAGAKSTQPKLPPASNNPQQQQAESYNRTMRRRMQSLGGDEDQQAESAQSKRKKQIERRKLRLEERRAELRKSLPNGGKISLGRKNLYFILAVLVVIILIILFAVLRQLHVF